MGLDGSTYTLEIMQGMNEIRLHWWHDLPAAWSGLAPLLARLHGLKA